MQMKYIWKLIGSVTLTELDIALRQHIQHWWHLCRFCDTILWECIISSLCGNLQRNEMVIKSLFPFKPFSAMPCYKQMLSDAIWDRHLGNSSRSRDDLRVLTACLGVGLIWVFPYYVRLRFLGVQQLQLKRQMSHAKISWPDHESDSRAPKPPFVWSKIF